MNGYKDCLNKYTCNVCGSFIITIDRDNGTTPMFISGAYCPTANCKGYLVSSWYIVDDVDGEPTYEWRKPTKKEYKKSSLDMKEHFDLGGLDIHKIVEVKKQ